MKVNVRKFLSGFTLDDLEKQGVLRPYGSMRLLQGASVPPLLKLMERERITRLSYPDTGWFLDIDGEFANPKCKVKADRTGNAKKLKKPGHVFDNQNKSINPHYYGGASGGASDEDKDESGYVVSDSGDAGKFSSERELQRALSVNIEQLEPGLRIIDTERTVEGGRIDILAEDADRNPVIIELKVDAANTSGLGQLQAYMGSEDFRGKSVRGILVAYKFDKRVSLAAKPVENVSLKKYSHQFTFEDWCD